MKKLLAIIATCIALSACTAPETTVATLEKAGYSNIYTTGWEMFGCGQDDVYSTGFIASNPKGVTVGGVVCCGVLVKGCTIRF